MHFTLKTNFIDQPSGVARISIITWVHLRVHKKTGPFVSMIYRMLAKDIVRFIIIYGIFIMAFSQVITLWSRDCTNFQRVLYLRDSLCFS